MNSRQKLTICVVAGGLALTGLFSNNAHAQTADASGTTTTGTANTGNNATLTPMQLQMQAAMRAHMQARINAQNAQTQPVAASAAKITITPDQIAKYAKLDAEGKRGMIEGIVYNAGDVSNEEIVNAICALEQYDEKTREAKLQRLHDAIKSLRLNGRLGASDELDTRTVLRMEEHESGIESVFGH